MSNNKSSSIDILCQKLANKLGLQAITFYIDHQEEIAEAKVMEMEQIMNAYKQGQYDGNNIREKDAYEYYNETFGGNNEQQ